MSAAEYILQFPYPLTDLPGDPRVQFRVQPLQFEADGVQLGEHLADDDPARQVCDAAQPLQPQLPVEHSRPLQPRPDVLAAEALPLRHDVRHAHRPPADRRRQLAADGVGDVGEAPHPTVEVGVGAGRGRGQGHGGGQVAGNAAGNAVGGNAGGVGDFGNVAKTEKYKQFNS